MCRTISLCTGMQSSTLAGLLASQFLGSSHAVPPACSVVAMAIMGLYLASFWGSGSRIRDTMGPFPQVRDTSLNAWGLRHSQLCKCMDVAVLSPLSPGKPISSPWTSWLPGINWFSSLLSNRFIADNGVSSENKDQYRCVFGIRRSQHLFFWESYDLLLL